MPAVPGKVRSGKQRVFFVQGTDDVPGRVFRAVIHKQDSAVAGDFPFFHELPHFYLQAGSGFVQNFLLIVTGDNDIQGVFQITQPLSYCFYDIKTRKESKQVFCGLAIFQPEIYNRRDQTLLMMKTEEA